VAPGEALTSVDAGNNWFCNTSYENGVCETVVNVGESVQWDVVQGVHTVTECDDSFSTCPVSGGFDSGILSNGESFSHTFTEVDTVEYLCTLHEEQMRGRVVVNAAPPTSTPTPTPPTPSPTPGPSPTPAYVFSELASTGKNEASGIAIVPGTQDEVVMTTRIGNLWKVDLSQPLQTPAPYGSIQDRVTRSGDEGLLDVNFEPGDASRVYVNYTRGTEYYRPYSEDPNKPPNPVMPPDPKRNRIARFPVTGGIMNAAAASEETIYESLRPGDWHTLGGFVFDANGYLYAGSGDGGWIYAPFDSDGGQGVENDLATIIRIDPNDASPGHTIPPGNPFDDGGGPNADQVWAYGLRNPWRIGFDTLNGNLWAGDVGQFMWEEVDLIEPGNNYGWSIMEGPVCMGGVACTPPANHIPPRTAYCNRYNTGEPSCEYDDDCAIMGGFVYRGTNLPDLYGHYVYGDFCTGRIRAFDTATSNPAYLLMDTGLNPVDFEQTPDGEILLLDYDGSIHQLDFDTDADGLGDLIDNCPAWANPLQNQPPWTVPVDDSDCDGWTTAREEHVGTDPTRHCNATSTLNDEPDFWPTDFNDSGFTTLADVSLFNPTYNKFPGQEGYSQRFDLNVTDSVTLADVASLSAFYNKSCS